MLSLVALRYASPWLIAHPEVTLPAQVVLVAVPIYFEWRLRRASLRASEPEASA
jgi:hypothetical protein